MSNETDVLNVDNKITAGSWPTSCGKCSFQDYGLPSAIAQECGAEDIFLVSRFVIL
jgi:hypothetical protein